MKLWSVADFRFCPSNYFQTFEDIKIFIVFERLHTTVRCYNFCARTKENNLIFCVFSWHRTFSYYKKNIVSEEVGKRVYNLFCLKSWWVSSYICLKFERKCTFQAKRLAFVMKTTVVSTVQFKDLYDYFYFWQIQHDTEPKTCWNKILFETVLNDTVVLINWNWLYLFPCTFFFI